MERHRGHFFNWYDTQTLQPLRPALRLVGGQRQPRRPPADAARRPLAPCRRAAARRRAVRRPATTRCGCCSRPCAAAATRCPWRASRRCSPTRAPPPPRTPDELRAAWQALTTSVPTTCSRPCRLTPRRRRAARRDARATRGAALGAGVEAPVRGRRRRDGFVLVAARGDEPRPVERGRTRRAAPTVAAALRAGRHDGRDGLRLPLRPGARPACDRLQRRRPAPRRRATTTCSPPRCGSRASSPSRRASCRRTSWFALGRQLATLDGKTVLLSWSGSMFEYLMPMLVMPSYENTLLDETLPRRGRATDRATAASAGCPGASPSRATTPPTRSSTTSTARSACRGWGSSAAWRRTSSSRPTRR